MVRPLFLFYYVSNFTICVLNSPVKWNSNVVIKNSYLQVPADHDHPPADICIQLPGTHTHPGVGAGTQRLPYQTQSFLRASHLQSS
jgi:hypothetical protein